MSMFGLGFVSVLLDIVMGTVTHNIYWSPYNPLFNNSSNNLAVREGDNIVLICPKTYEMSERISIYWTKNNDIYRNCGLFADSDRDDLKLLFTCSTDKPNNEFRLQVSIYSWVMANPNFVHKKPVYFLPQKELCERFGMKLVTNLKDELNDAELNSQTALQVRSLNHSMKHDIPHSSLIFVGIYFLLLFLL